MNKLAIVLLIITIILYIIQYSKNREIKKQLDYTNNILDKIIIEDTEEYILSPTNEEIIKENIIAINKLLEKYYIDKLEFKNNKREMERLMTNISHDFKTPLTVLKGYGEILELNSVKENLPVEIVNNIIKLNNKIDEIINIQEEYFNSSKIISGDIILEMKNLNIVRIFREVLLEFYELLEERNYNVEIDIPDTEIIINGDEEALKRVLRNGIDNGIKYSVKNYIGFRIINNDNIIIEIENYSDNIDLSKDKKLFERLYRVEDKNVGSGLGLSISEELVNAMNGELSIKTTMDKKMIFSIILKKLEKS